MLDVIGSRALLAPGTGGCPEPQDELVRMLADMDARLRALQQELESVALPLARSTRSPQRPRAELPAAANDAAGRRVRATRRVRAVTGAVPSEASEEGAAQRFTDPAAPVASAQTAVRRTIREADEEARQVVDQARQQIVEIGARTRKQLERTLAEPPGLDTPATASGGLRRWASSASSAELREYEGAVTVEAGPFAEFEELSDFESTLASIPGVADVHIRALEQQRALFDVHIVAPTRLIAELRDRAPDGLRVVEAGATDVSVEHLMDAVAAR